MLKLRVLKLSMRLITLLLMILTHTSLMLGTLKFDVEFMLRMFELAFEVVGSQTYEFAASLLELRLYIQKRALPIRLRKEQFGLMFSQHVFRLGVQSSILLGLTVRMALVRFG